jgi:hypothetical protein
LEEGNPSRNCKKQARLAGEALAGAGACAEKPGAGKLVSVAEGGKLHRRGEGKTHFPRDCTQTRRPEKAGAVSRPPVCLERGKLVAEGRAQENSEYTKPAGPGEC